MQYAENLPIEENNGGEFPAEHADKERQPISDEHWTTLLQLRNVSMRYREGLPLVLKGNKK